VTHADDYRRLRTRIAAERLFEKTPAIYMFIVVLSLIGVAGSFLMLTVLGGRLWPLASVIIMIAYSQLGFVGHDSGHRSVFRSNRANDILGYPTWSLLLGISYRWWFRKHNAHHGRPNEMGADPDIDYPLVAMAAEQLESVPKALRLAIRFQAYYFYPILGFMIFMMRLRTFIHLLTTKYQGRWIEVLLVPLHFVIYLGLLLTILEPAQAIGFIVAHHILMGFYFGVVFAPNHVGMPIFREGQRPSFLQQQVETARNIRGGVWLAYFYGGLNYQIEHHLFPLLPRFRLARAREIIRPFCKEVGVIYQETSVFGALRDIAVSLNDVARLAFKPKPVSS